MIYSALLKNVLVRVDPEAAHEKSFAALRLAERLPIVRSLLHFAGHSGPASRPRQVMGITFAHPLGMAAGFDKNGIGVLPLLSLGFSHVEIGTITGQPQPGNPTPRLFRLIDDDAIINRMGFNNVGARQAASALANLRVTKRGRGAVVGVNIGKTKAVPVSDAIDDYRQSTRYLAPLASYLVVNVSSPNTPGLRDLQAVEELRPLLEAVREEAVHSAARHVPLLVKIAPDLSDADIDAVAELAKDIKLDGVIAANTTISRPKSLRTAASKVAEIGDGGLSGPILKARSLEVLQRLRRQLPKDIAIVSVGGVDSPVEAAKRMDAGADLIQAYTGFIFGGPLWPGKIRRGLARRCF